MGWTRKIKKTDLVDKTIKDIDCTAVNVLILYFTDGTKCELEVENVGYGIYGIMTLPTPEELLNESTKK